MDWKLSKNNIYGCRTTFGQVFNGISERIQDILQQTMNSKTISIFRIQINK